jgi:hypothetical protein
MCVTSSSVGRVGEDGDTASEPRALDRLQVRRLGPFREWLGSWLETVAARETHRRGPEGLNAARCGVLERHAHEIADRDDAHDHPAVDHWQVPEATMNHERGGVSGLV